MPVQEGTVPLELVNNTVFICCIQTSRNNSEHYQSVIFPTVISKKFEKLTTYNRVECIQKHQLANSSEEGFVSPALYFF